MLQQYLPFTVLKRLLNDKFLKSSLLQQYLPFTVLKLCKATLEHKCLLVQLQQYLPFTVLKHDSPEMVGMKTALQQYLPFTVLKPLTNADRIFNPFCCNSTYRLRY